MLIDFEVAIFVHVRVCVNIRARAWSVEIRVQNWLSIGQRKLPKTSKIKLSAIL